MLLNPKSCLNLINNNKAASVHTLYILSRSVSVHCSLLRAYLVSWVTDEFLSTISSFTSYNTRSTYTALFIDICIFFSFFRERRKESERNINMLFHLFMHSVADSYMCPDQGSNLQPWCTGTMLQPTELPDQGVSAQLCLSWYWDMWRYAFKWLDIRKIYVW